MNKLILLVILTLALPGISGCCPLKQNPSQEAQYSNELVQPPGLAGPFRWELLGISGIKTDSPPENQQLPYIRFDHEHGRAYGYSGCNRFTGAFKSGEDNSLTFSAMASTKMACKDMDIEHHFLQVLQKTKSYEIVNGRLRLLGSDSEILAEFTARTAD